MEKKEDRREMKEKDGYLLDLGHFDGVPAVQLSDDVVSVLKKCVTAAMPELIFYVPAT